MARLQILELPEGAADDRPPFILVIDQVPTNEAKFDALRRDLGDHEDFVERIGARAILVFEDTIDIPANDAAAPVIDEAFKTEAQGWATATNETLARIIDAMSGQTKRRPATEGLRLAHERTDIARDMDRLAKRRNELADALGMDRTRDWDDIRDTAAELRQERDSRADAIERVRRLHRPVTHQGQVICWECSAYDFAGLSTDNAPVAYDQCRTNQALTVDKAAEEAEDWHGILLGRGRQLTKALNISPLNDWDGILGAAARVSRAHDSMRDAIRRVRDLPEQPEAMDAQHPNPRGYLHGYSVAVRAAKRATKEPERTRGTDG